MEITEEMLRAVPADNVRVRVEDFAALWRVAEDECLRLVLSTPSGTWELSYTSAVMGTIRWLAGTQVPLGLPTAPTWVDAPAPYSGEQLGAADGVSIRAAYEESARLQGLFPDGYKTEGMPPRPGYLEGVRDTIGWACFLGPAPRLASSRPDATKAG